jgi:Dock homology region 2
VQRYNDTQEDEKVSALLKVIEYVLQAGKLALFNKYSLMLCAAHEANKNFVEAALCLLLVASKLSFTSESILAPIAATTSDTQWSVEESERCRKERLYLRAIDLLDRGKDWERAVVLIRELIPIYELQTFEYKKLADLLRR